MEQGKEDLGGPYLRSAFFCERLLQESDGVFSAIRMVNWVSARLGDDSQPGDTEYAFIDMSLFVSFITGSARGERDLTVVMESPTEAGPVLEFTVTMLFDGGEDDVAATYWPVVLELAETGVYWFAVYLDNRLVTRVPLRVAAPERVVSWGLQ